MDYTWTILGVSAACTGGKHLSIHQVRRTQSDHWLNLHVSLVAAILDYWSTKKKSYPTDQSMIRSPPPYNSLLTKLSFTTLQALEMKY
jgi:hypothetical protein